MLLEFNNVCGITEEFSLKNISFTLGTGYLLGLTRKNGAGKTSLIKYMIDSEQKYTGEILFRGKNIKENHNDFLEEIAYVSEDNIYFMEYTADENTRLLQGFYKTWDHRLFCESMNKMNLSIRKQLGAMSRGEYMKFQMAFSIAHSPKLYLLDEVTAGMDPVFRRDFHKIIRELLANEASVLMTTHIQSEIDRNMDYVGIMEEGRLLSLEENLS